MKISILSVALLSTPLLSTSGISPEQNPINGKERPNVLFIICDDLNDAVEGFGGHPQAITPNMDRLAKIGVRFVNAQNNCPLCGPSRASLWSGLYPHTTGYFGYNQQPNNWRENPVLKNTVTLFENMTIGGYKVYATGKVHHNYHEDWNVFKDQDGKSGFGEMPNMGPYPSGKNEDYPGLGNIHPDMPIGMKGSGWDSNFGPIRIIDDCYENTGFWLYKNHTKQIYHYRSDSDRDLMPDERSVVFAKGILEQDHKMPFMLTVGFNRPHSPLHVPEKYYKMYGLDTLMVASILEDDLADCSKVLYQDFDIGTGKYGFDKYKYIEKSGEKETLKLWTQAYLACVTFVDDQLGQLLDALEKSKYASNTIVILTSDNGYHMGEKKQLFKNSVWEESTRIPLVIAGPDIQQSGICEAPVSLIDLYPTIVDFCKLPTHPNKNGNGKPLDGYSLRKLLADTESKNWEGPEIALTALASDKTLKINEPGLPKEQHYSIRSKQYRYIVCRNGEEELYDHFSDPNEWRNIARDEKYKSVKENLKKQFERIVFK